MTHGQKQQLQQQQHDPPVSRGPSFDSLVSSAAASASTSSSGILSDSISSLGNSRFGTIRRAPSFSFILKFDTNHNHNHQYSGDGFVGKVVLGDDDQNNDRHHHHQQQHRQQQDTNKRPQ